MIRQILSLTLLNLGLLIAGCNAQTPDTPPSSAPIGPILIHDGWIRETPPGAKVAAAYFTVENTSDKAIRIEDARFELIERSEIHSMQMQDGMMRMRQLKHLDIAAGTSHALQPSGDHLMLFEPQQPLRHGMSMQGLLILADGRQIKLELPVLASAPSDHAQH